MTLEELLRDIDTEVHGRLGHHLDGPTLKELASRLIHPEVAQQLRSGHLTPQVIVAEAMHALNARNGMLPSQVDQTEGMPQPPEPPPPDPIPETGDLNASI